MHRRHQIAVRNVLRHVQAGKQDLLDHLAARIAQLRLQRHGRVLIQPQTIAETILILGRDGDHPGGAAEHMRIRQGLDAIEVVHVGAELRQRAQERAAVLARLHQHGVLIGQIAGQLVVVAHEFPARSIQRLQPFGHPPGAHTMHDAHGFDPAFAQMEERAIVISRADRPRPGRAARRP